MKDLKKDGYQLHIAFEHCIADVVYDLIDTAKGVHQKEFDDLVESIVDVSNTIPKAGESAEDIGSFMFSFVALRRRSKLQKIDYEIRF